MLIINADDWGGWRSATDAALACYSQGRITSATAMVFMEDSERAADLAKEAGMDVGLHLNLNQKLTGKISSRPLLAESHDAVARFLRRSKYSLLFYNPLLRRQFRYVYQCQVDEFARLYGSPPSHIDGHQHMHLCTNMLIGRVIPSGQKVRRSFSFWPGEKNRLNRAYRRCIDSWLARRHRITDFFFALSQYLQPDRFRRVVQAAREANVELMTHPEIKDEYSFLMSDAYLHMIQGLSRESYAEL